MLGPRPTSGRPAGDPTPFGPGRERAATALLPTLVLSALLPGATPAYPPLPDLAIAAPAARRGAEGVEVEVINLGDAPSPPTLLMGVDRPPLLLRGPAHEILPGERAAAFAVTPAGSDRLVLHLGWGAPRPWDRISGRARLEGARFGQVDPAERGLRTSPDSSDLLLDSAGHASGSFRVEIHPSRSEPVPVLDLSGIRVAGEFRGREIWFGHRWLARVGPDSGEEDRGEDDRSARDGDAVDPAAARFDLSADTLPGVSWSRELEVEPLAAGERRRLQLVDAPEGRPIYFVIDPRASAPDRRRGNNAAVLEPPWRGDLIALHVHTSFSEGRGSFDLQSRQLAESGYRLAWITDHDWRLRLLGFPCRASDRPGWPAVGRLELGEDDGPGGRCLVSPSGTEFSVAAATAPEPGRRLDPPREWTVFYRQPRNTHVVPLAAGLHLRLRLADVRLTSGEAAALVRLTLSDHPDGRRHLTYLLSPDPRVARRLALPGEKTVPVRLTSSIASDIQLHPSADAAAAWPGPEDDHVHDIEIGLRHQGHRVASFRLRSLSLEAERDGLPLLAAARELASGYPNLDIRIGSEISHRFPHVNAFTETMPFLDYDALTEREACAEAAVSATHRLGGLASLNHPFGALLHYDPLTVERLLERRFFDADLLEVGYKMRGGRDLRAHLDLWDRAGAGGVILTGVGANDSHGEGAGIGWYADENNLGTRLPPDPSGGPLAALARGEVTIEDPLRFDGTLRLEGAGSLRPGRVLLADPHPEGAPHSFTLWASGLQAGARVMALAGGRTVFEQSLATGGELRARVEVADLPGPVRAEAFDGTGQPLALTNPVYLLPADTLGEGGVPADRLAPDLAGLVSAEGADFTLLRVDRRSEQLLLRVRARPGGWLRILADQAPPRVRAYDGGPPVVPRWETGAGAGRWMIGPFPAAGDYEIAVGPSVTGVARSLIEAAVLLAVVVLTVLVLRRRPWRRSAAIAAASVLFVPRLVFGAGPTAPDLVVGLDSLHLTGGGDLEVSVLNAGSAPSAPTSVRLTDKPPLAVSASHGPIFPRHVFLRGERGLVIWPEHHEDEFLLRVRWQGWRDADRFAGQVRVLDKDGGALLPASVIPVGDLTSRDIRRGAEGRVIWEAATGRPESGLDLRYTLVSGPARLGLESLAIDGVPNLMQMFVGNWWLIRYLGGSDEGEEGNDTGEGPLSVVIPLDDPRLADVSLPAGPAGLLLEKPLGALEPGERGTVVFPLPPSIPDLFIDVDPADRVIERLEGNNVAHRRQPSGPPMVSLHTHASLSEGTASVDAQMDLLARSGYDAVFWTEHDWILSGHGVAPLYSFEEEPSPRTWFLMTNRFDPGLETSAGPTAERATDGRRALRLRARRTGLAATSSEAVWVFRVYRSARPRALAQELTVAFDLYPSKETPDGTEFLVELELSDQPRVRRRLEYRLAVSRRSSPPAGSLRLLATAPSGKARAEIPPGRWTRIQLPVSVAARASFPEGVDNSLSVLHFGIAVRHGEGVFDVDRLDMHTEVLGSPLLALQKGWTEAYPGIASHVVNEMSYYVPHFNQFVSSPFLLDYSRLPPEHFGAACLEEVRRRNGALSLNHPLGFNSTFPPRIVENQVRNRLFGADLLEVGYRLRGGVDLAGHLAFWDRVLALGMVPSGIGVTDAHGVGRGNGFARDENNFATWVDADPASVDSLIDGLLAGRTRFGDPLLFSGSLQLQVDGRYGPGAVLIGPPRPRRAVFGGERVPPGSRLDLVADGRIRASLTASSEGRAEGRGDLPASVHAVRVEARDPRGEPLAISNVVAFLDQVPPEGLPASRLRAELRHGMLSADGRFRVTSLQIVRGGVEVRGGQGSGTLRIEQAGAPPAVVASGGSGAGIRWSYDAASDRLEVPLSAPGVRLRWRGWSLPVTLTGGVLIAVLILLAATRRKRRTPAP